MRKYDLLFEPLSTHAAGGEVKALGAEHRHIKDRPFKRDSGCGDEDITQLFFPGRHEEIFDELLHVSRVLILYIDPLVPKAGVDRIVVPDNIGGGGGAPYHGRSGQLWIKRPERLYQFFFSKRGCSRGWVVIKHHDAVFRPEELIECSGYRPWICRQQLPRHYRHRPDQGFNGHSVDYRLGVVQFVNYAGEVLKVDIDCLDFATVEETLATVFGQLPVNEAVPLGKDAAVFCYNRKLNHMSGSGGYRYRSCLVTAFGTCPSTELWESSTRNSHSQSGSDLPFWCRQNFSQDTFSNCSLNRVLCLHLFPITLVYVFAALSVLVSVRVMPEPICSTRKKPPVSSTMQTWSPSRTGTAGTTRYGILGWATVIFGNGGFFVCI